MKNMEIQIIAEDMYRAKVDQDTLHYVSPVGQYPYEVLEEGKTLVVILEDKSTGLFGAPLGSIPRLQTVNIPDGIETIIIQSKKMDDLRREKRIKEMARRPSN